MPKISILMNCYNGEQFLRQAIDSIFAQTFDDWEIIFVDNCSTDKSAEIAKSYGDKLRYHKTDKNIPLYAARNFGLKFIKGDYLAFLDVDDWWLPEKLEKQMAVFDEKPDCWLAHSAVYFKLHDQEKLVSKINGHGKTTTFNYSLKNYIVNIQSAMVRYSALPESLKKFNSNLSIAGDYCFFMKLLADRPAAYIPECLSVTRFHEQNLSKTLQANVSKETLVAHEEIAQSANLTAWQKSMIDYRNAKEFYIDAIAQSDLKTARQIIRPHVFAHKHALPMYLAAFTKWSANKILQRRLH